MFPNGHVPYWALYSSSNTKCENYAILKKPSQILKNVHAILPISVGYESSRGCAHCTDESKMGSYSIFTMLALVFLISEMKLLYYQMIFIFILEEKTILLHN